MEVPDVLRWVALGVMILGVGLVFALVLRRLVNVGRARDVDETRESLVSRDLIQKQISAAWRGLVSRISRRRPRGERPFLSLDREVGTRRMIREVYQALLAFALVRGQSRRPSQTPSEYAAELAKLWRADSDALAAIADGYVQARYSSLSPSEEQARLIEQAWMQVRSALESRPQDQLDRSELNAG